MSAMSSIWIVAAALTFGQAKSIAKPNAAPTLEVVGESGGAMAPVARAMKAHFAEAYPKLVKRFGRADGSSPQLVRLKFDPALKIPAHCVGNEVTVSVPPRHPCAFA